jgi:hypothetical protein
MEARQWQTLAHVCRRWRSIVFGSPRGLNLRLVCTPKTPARYKLDIWPALPLVVSGNMESSSSTNNVIAALGQNNRVCQVNLCGLADWQLEEVLAPMQVSFPELTVLRLSSDNETLPVIPDSFLGGSAPRLQSFYWDGIPFPGLPNLLLSASHLVSLWLNNIPHSGCISPEAMAALLSVSSSLKRLELEFELQSFQSRPDWEGRSLPPPKRSILPALQEFRFKGDTEYLEGLVTHIDTPRLDGMHITFFDQIDFDCPRLGQFIDRTPKFGTHDTAFVLFGNWHTSVALLNLEIVISWREPDRQLSSIAQVCNSLHLLSTIEHLYIERQAWARVSQIDAIENTEWLQLFLPFTAVKYLFPSEEFAPGIAFALQELVGVTEVLPSLQHIFVEGPEPSGPVKKNIAKIVAARQLSDHTIAISDWDEDSDMESM